MHEPRRDIFDEIDDKSREDAVRLILELMRSNERSLETVQLDSPEFEDENFDSDTGWLPSTDEMPRLFDAASRCPKLSEFLAPCAANKRLRARHTLILPLCVNSKSARSVIDFDELFRGALNFPFACR